MSKQAKVVKVGIEGEQLLEQITRHTNTQNAIREKDFRLPPA
jgi:hypothetical protein